jgi:hypothetical protein
MRMLSLVQSIVRFVQCMYVKSHASYFTRHNFYIQANQGRYYQYSLVSNTLEEW